MNRRILYKSLIVASVISLCSVASAANWPRFRGPNGTGVAEDKDIPVRWNEKENILWKTALPGTGNSSPVIWGRHIFVQSTSANGKERRLICVRADDGRVMWTRAAPATTAHTHPKNTLASSTPATDGERVYALFWDGADVSLHAYDFNGEPVWKRDLGSFTSQHGAGASPIVFDGKVFLNHDQDQSALLIALDAKTGKTIWQTPRRGFRTCYSTPFIRARTGGDPELIVASTAGVMGYNPRTGDENWRWIWTVGRMPLRTVGSPICDGELIFANSGDGAGDRDTVAIHAGGKGDVTQTHLAWEKKQTLPYVPTMLARDGYLYFVNDKGLAGCCAASSGESVWLERLGGNVSASPILVDGKIYAANESGDVYIFEAGPKFKLIAKNSVGEPVIATPAVADNRLYIRGHTHLFCIGKLAAK